MIAAIRSSGAAGLDYIESLCRGPSGLDRLYAFQAITRLAEVEHDAVHRVVVLLAQADPEEVESLVQCFIRAYATQSEEERGMVGKAMADVMSLDTRIRTKFHLLGAVHFYPEAAAVLVPRIEEYVAHDESDEVRRAGVEALGKLLPIAEAADALRRVAETHTAPDIRTLAKLELERHALK